MNKILIANRGEIAARICRTAKRMGIKTVAIYSSVDKNALHVSVADEAYCLGDGELKETYLNINKIIQIAKISGSDAVHPGYGFLSENPLFAEACEKENIIFIGPSSEKIKLMGNKIEARKIAKEVGIPMTAGVEGTVETLLNTEITIAYPLLIKAAAGGGGKGMKIVTEPSMLREALESASREALNYFGDGTVYIEKYIENPRHIEIQVFGDNHGNCIHLYERECTIQRRHQKIIEESPSPTLNDAIRKLMGEAAVKISKQINYNNAGTIEFLVDKDLNFYFLEMNTRIQVEHPVTEMVTGIDMVEEQIRIASGEPLRYQQSDIKQNGAAIECRIYAESPENNFLPSPGEMTFYNEPIGNYIRVDASIKEKTTIHSFFDPMISKLVVWSENRETTRKKMLEALKTYVVHGISQNIEYLTEILRQPAYISNNISTDFCNKYTSEIIERINQSKQSLTKQPVLIAALLLDFISSQNNTNIWNQTGYWRSTMNIKFQLDAKDFEIHIQKISGNFFSLIINGLSYEVLLLSYNNGKISFSLNNLYYMAFVSFGTKGKTFVTLDGITFTANRLDVLNTEIYFTGSESNLQNHGNIIISPMFGKVVKVNIKEGDEIKKGTTLLVLEAMKMENNIVAAKDAVIEKINVQIGQMVETDAKLVMLKEE